MEECRLYIQLSFIKPVQKYTLPNQISFIESVEVYTVSISSVSSNLYTIQVIQYSVSSVSSNLYRIHIAVLVQIHSICTEYTVQYSSDSSNLYRILVQFHQTCTEYTVQYQFRFLQSIQDTQYSTSSDSSNLYRIHSTVLVQIHETNTGYNVS